MPLLKRPPKALLADDVVMYLTADHPVFWTVMGEHSREPAAVRVISGPHLEGHGDPRFSDLPYFLVRALDGPSAGYESHLHLADYNLVTDGGGYNLHFVFAEWPHARAFLAEDLSLYRSALRAAETKSLFWDDFTGRAGEV